MNKKYFFILLTFIFLTVTGCKNKSIDDSKIELTPIPVIVGELDYATLIPETDDIKNQIKQNFIHYPTDILVDYNENEIRWFCDNGGGINEDLWTEEDTKVWIENERAIYKGVLTQLDEGIYSSKGVFVPSMTTEAVVSETVDFYFIVKENKATFVFESLSNEDLNTFNITSYYYCLPSYDDYPSIYDINCGNNVNGSILVRYGGSLYAQSNAMIDYVGNTEPIGFIHELIPPIYVPKENGQTNQGFLLNAEVHEGDENSIILFYDNVYHLYEKIDS